MWTVPPATPRNFVLTGAVFWFLNVNLYRGEKGTGFYLSQDKFTSHFLKEKEVQLLFLEYGRSIKEKKELGSTFKSLILLHIFLKEEEIQLMNSSSNCYSLNMVGLEDEEAMRKVSRLLSSPSFLPSFSSSLLHSKLLEGKFEEEWVMRGLNKRRPS
jgi:hypothetical protein